MKEVNDRASDQFNNDESDEEDDPREAELWKKKEVFSSRTIQAHLTDSMAANYWKFGALSEPNRRVHEVNIVSLENRIDQLTNVISSQVAEKKQSFRDCGICTMTDHATDYCPILHEENEWNHNRTTTPRDKEAKTPTNPDFQEEDDAATKEGSPTPEPEASPYAVQPHFPSRFIKEDNQAEEKENLYVFRKVEINVPLLEIIQKIPRYAYFLKDLYTNKRRLFGHEKVNPGENNFTNLTRRLPPKIKDQDMFAITRAIHKIYLKEVLSWTKL
ncbi:hypothetical protein V6N11_008956 [Hibiscus sabdariffa]|uniref:Uncharacterized protein n=1 Tax=Hibiscus sabdariffa TaxID=183260 RepID=A0ABR2PPB2_9ROSI